MLGVGLALGPRHGVGGVQQAGVVEHALLAGAGEELGRLEAGLDVEAALDVGEEAVAVAAGMVPGEAGGQTVPAGQHLLDGAGERGLGERDGQDLDRAGEAVVAPAALGQDGGAGLRHQLARGAVVDGLEVRRHPGLEREALEQRLAKRVDRHDAQAPRQVEHAGEEAAGVAQGAGRGRLAGQLLDLGRERLLVARDRPRGELALDPRPHLGGGGLGEGEAEDGVGPRAGQQEAEHAVGEDARLAGAGVGRDPDRAAGVGGAALGGGGGEAGAHGSPPASRHSATRARCS